MARNEQGELTSIWTPANVITSVRICFIPVFMLLAVLSRDAMGALTHPAFAIGACALYILLSLTDKLDGSLARKRNEITDFGKFLDPIADKLLVFSALLLLLDQGYVNVWVVFIILLREFLVSALRMVGYDDAISIEHEDSLMTPNEGLQKAIAFLKEVLMYEDKGAMWWA